MASKKKTAIDIIALQCTECKRKNYTTTKNRKNIQGKLEKNKYCPENVKEYIQMIVDYAHAHKCNLSYREILTTCGYTEIIRYIDNGR